MLALRLWATMPNSTAFLTPKSKLTPWRSDPGTSSLHTEYQRSELVYYSNFQNKASIMAGYNFLKLNVQSMIKMKLRTPGILDFQKT